MPDIQTADRLILYHQPDGKGSAMKPLSLDKHGLADVVQPGPGRTPNFGRDAFGRFIVKFVQNDPPGGLITTTLEEDDTGTISYLAKQFDRQGCFPVQRRLVKCGRLDIATNWDRIEHIGEMTITQKTNGAGPNRDASGPGLFNSFEISSSYLIQLLKHALTSLTVGEVNNFNDMAVLSDLIVGCQDCFPGYTPDKTMYLVPAASAGSPGDRAEVWYSTDGGSTWAATSADPFAATEDILEIEIGFLTDTTFRLIVAGGAGNEVLYSDVTIGAEGTTVWAGTATVGTSIEDMKWLFFDRLYVAADGDVYVSTDQGESFGSAIKSTANQINAIIRNYDGDEVYVAGTNNFISRERNQSDTFEDLVGPSGGGSFTALFIANDGRLYAGNGTSLYVSNNKALNAGGWTELKDFTSDVSATAQVVSINCPGSDRAQGGDSQLIRVVVDDTAPGTASVWESEDGGNRFTQITTLTNTGYNGAVFSPIDDNLAWVFGDGGVLQKFSPKA